MEYLTIDLVVWAVFCAIFAAIIYTFFMQRCLSKLAKKILEKKVFAEDTALSLEELGYKNSLEMTATKFFAKNGNYLSKVIKRVEPENDESLKSGDTDQVLFGKKTQTLYYVPEESIDKKFDKFVKDKMSVPKLFAVIAVVVVMALVASTVIDMLTKYASRLADFGNNNAIGVTEDGTTLLEEQAEANKQEELEEKKAEALEEIEEQKRKELEEAMKAQNQGEAINEESDEADANPNKDTE